MSNIIWENVSIIFNNFCGDIVMGLRFWYIKLINFFFNFFTYDQRKWRFIILIYVFFYFHFARVIFKLSDDIC